MKNNISLKYKSIFFDLDRTLWDFDRSALMAFEEIFEKHKLLQLGVPSVSEFLKSYTIHNEELWAKYRIGEITKERLRGLRFYLTLNDFEINNEKLAESRLQIIPDNQWVQRGSNH